MPRLRAALAFAAVLAVATLRHATASAPERAWLAGDLHVHTCYSHDGWCPPDDDNTPPTEAYTLSGSVEERFVEAAARRLDYLAITDHDDLRSLADDGFGTHGVVGIPGYELSIRGHAQMLGAMRRYEPGDGTPAAVTAMADELRAHGGVFQANHPGGPSPGCDDTDAMVGKAEWEYGYDVLPDVIEVWNWTSSDRPLFWWECWLSGGARIGATGGSDSHWLSTTAVQGPGNPTTWVLAEARTAAAILSAIRAGRTSITARPPVEDPTVLLLEADADGDDAYESTAGDTVPPGAAMRVRDLSGLAAGIVEVRANGATIVSEVLVPGGAVRFAAPTSGWVRATLRTPEGWDERATACALYPRNMPASCTDRFGARALTSPIYVAP